MARVIILPREKSGFDPRQATIAAISQAGVTTERRFLGMALKKLSAAL
jgi:hypothetical protein